MEGSAVLDDDVFGGDEEVFDSAVEEEEVHDCAGEVEAELGGEPFVLSEDHFSQGHPVDELLGDEDGVGFIDALLFLLQLLLIPAQPAVVDVQFGLGLFVLGLLEFFEVLRFIVEIPFKLLDVMGQLLPLILFQGLVVYLCSFLGQFLDDLGHVVQRFVAVLVALPYLLQFLKHFLPFLLVCFFQLEVGQSLLHEVSGLSDQVRQVLILDLNIRQELVYTLYLFIHIPPFI